MSASQLDIAQPAGRARAGAWLKGQMRNIAPFATLLALMAFFSIASPSFATLDNAGNILTQVSVTAIIAVGLTFVILCAEIDIHFPLQGRSDRVRPQTLPPDGNDDASRRIAPMPLRAAGPC